MLYYATLITLHYNYNLQLQLHYIELQLQLHYTTLHPAVVVRWPLQPLQPLQKTQLQPPFGPSVDSLCHPWVTTTTLSYRFPIFETSATALCGTTGIFSRELDKQRKDWVPGQSRELASVRKRPQTCWSLRWIARHSSAEGNPAMKENKMGPNLASIWNGSDDWLWRSESIYPPWPMSAPWAVLVPDWSRWKQEHTKCPGRTPDGWVAQLFELRRAAHIKCY